jgi:hypothetical protein
MNVKSLRLLAAVLAVGSIAESAIADTLGEHPAVLVARTWDARGIDPNTFIVLHPSGPMFLAESPTETAAREQTPRTHLPRSAAANQGN